MSLKTNHFTDFLKQKSCQLDDSSKSYHTLKWDIEFSFWDSLQGFQIFVFEIILVFLLDLVELLKDIIFRLHAGPHELKREDFIRRGGGRILEKVPNIGLFREQKTSFRKKYV